MKQNDDSTPRPVDELQGWFNALHESDPPVPNTPDPSEADSLEAISPPNMGEEQPVEAVPRRAGACEVLALRAKGGMGVVYLGRDPELGCLLAVKALQERHQGRPDLVRRFQKEARLTALLQHPGIPPVHSVGRLDDGRPYFTMKYVRGNTLGEQLKNRSWSGKELSSFVRDFWAVCQTMAYAHQRGVIHRDLKSTNIMVGAHGEALVIDWGLAEVLDQAHFSGAAPFCEESCSLPAAGESAEVRGATGTLAYMDPTQANNKGEAFGRSCDVFSLGAILCEILTGQPAYVGTQEELLAKAKASPANDLSANSARRRLDACREAPDLVRLAKSCLGLGPDAQPGDAGELAERVASYFAKLEERDRKAAVARATRPRNILLALSVSVLLVMGLATFGWWEFRQWQLAESVDAQFRQTEPLLAEVRQAPRDLARRNQLRLQDEKLGALLGSEEDAGESWGRSRQLREQVAKTLLQAEKDDADIAESETLRVLPDQGPGRFDLAEADRRYAEFFRKIGIDLDMLTTEEAAAQVRARDIWVELVSALDDWGVVRASRLNEAGKDWQRVSAVAKAVNPDPVRVALRDAIERHDRQRIRELADAVDLATYPPGTVMVIGQALGEFVDAEQATTFLYRAQRQYPNDFWINYHLAWYYGQLKPPRWAEQVRFYTLAAALRKQDVGVLNNLGAALARNGDIGEAILVFKEAIRLAPQDALSQRNLALALEQAKRPEEAIAAFQKATELNSHDVEAWGSLGALRLRQDNKTAEAIIALDEAIALGTRSPATYDNRAVAAERQGQFEEVRKYYDSALKYDPHHAVTLTNLAILMVKKKIPEGSEGPLALLDKAIQGDPKYVPACALRAMLHRDAQRSDLSIADWRKVLELSPDHAVAHWELGKLLRSRGELTAALSHMQQGHDLGRHRPNWPTGAEAALKECENDCTIDRLRVSLLTARQATSLPPATVLKLADLSALRQCYLDAAEYYNQLMTANPVAAATPEAKIRFNAACSAWLAGNGQGERAKTITKAEGERWREQALRWLRADLEALGAQLGTPVDGRPQNSGKSSAKSS